jgi:ribose transport system substrate-binding protein
MAMLIGLAVAPSPVVAGEIGVILIDHPDNFFRSLERGIRRGAKDLGIPLLIRTPREWAIPNGHNNPQLNVADFMIERKVSAIILAPGPLEAVAAPLSLPVPLILVDRDGPLFSAQSTVSTDNFAAGRKAGLNLAKVLPRGANVGIFRLAADIPSTTQREEGFLSVAREKGWNVKVDIFVGLHPRKAEARIAEALRDAPSRLDAVFAPNESVATEAVQVVASLPPQSRPHLATFDWKLSFRQALESGVLDCTVLQDPEDMGYRSVVVAAKARDGQTVPDKVMIETILVTRENLDEPAIRSAISAYETP